MSPHLWEQRPIAVLELVRIDHEADIMPALPAGQYGLKTPFSLSPKTDLFRRPENFVRAGRTSGEPDGFVFQMVIHGSTSGPRWRDEAAFGR